MASFEQSPLFEDSEGTEAEAIFGDDFDINAAFQEAMQEVASSEELALDEKVRRMEVIVAEGTSEVYREFVDFSAMAAQMEMMCSHDHQFNESIQGSEALSGFMNSYKSDARDGNDDVTPGRHSRGEGGGNKAGHKYKTKKKKKKSEWRGWFGAAIIND